MREELEEEGEEGALVAFRLNSLAHTCHGGVGDISDINAGWGWRWQNRVPREWLLSSP